MSKFSWTEEESFRDVPSEAIPQQSFMADANGNTMLQPESQGYVQLSPVNEQQFYQTFQESNQELDDDEDYTSVLSDARLRLEQGKLYEMVMNHDLFEGMEIDPRAVKHVQKEIRRFAKERMEIMLGMRQEASKSEFISSPFNDLEVSVIKRMASMYTKGATESPEANQLATHAPQAPKKTSINPIKAVQTYQPKPVTKLQSAAVPVQRQSVKHSTQIPQEDERPLEKPVSEMTGTELEERNKRIGDRQAGRRVIPPAHTRAPMPTFEQQHSYYTMQGMSTSPTVNNILNLINRSKNGQ